MFNGKSCRVVVQRGVEVSARLLRCPPLGDVIGWKCAGVSSTQQWTRDFEQDEHKHCSFPLVDGTVCNNYPR